MARMRWNPITGRYESGSEIDPNTGQPVAPRVPLVTQPYTPSESSNQSKPPAQTRRTPTTTTTTVPKSTTTTVPKSTTTTVPKSTTTTVPKSTTTTAPKSTTTTVPKGQQSKTKTGSGGKVSGGTARNYESPVPFSGAGSDLVGPATEEALQGGNMGDITELLRLLGIGSGGGGGSASSQQADRNRMAAELTKQANRNYNVDTANVGKYYSDQQAAALAAIQKAMEEYRATLPEPTAFQNVPLSALPQTQQGLTEELLRQGATAQTAEAQMASDAAMAQRIAEISGRGATDLQSANKAFFDVLGRAGLGGQAASIAGLTQNLSSLQAQEQARLRQNQQDLLLQALKLRYGG